MAMGQQGKEWEVLLDAKKFSGEGVSVIENLKKAVHLPEKCKYTQNFTNDFRRFTNHLKLKPDLIQNWESH